MKLVEFKNSKGKTIYINPEQVESVETLIDGIVCVNMAITDGGSDTVFHHVCGSIEEVVQKLRNAR